VINYDYNKLKQLDTLKLIYNTFVTGAIIQGLGNFFIQYICQVTPPDISFAYKITAAPIVSVFFSSINEELIYRRIIFRYLDKKFGFCVGAIISSILFMFSHYNYAAWLGYFGIAMVWCYFYKKSNSIAVTIVAHMIMNFVVFVIHTIEFK
jgi:membrane protease YdiL (CAAX protease family)